jgi:two-component system heavy metal sensor histidine kinase CusS
MSLKNVNFRKNWSITGRLSVLYTLSTLAMLIAFAAYSYYALVTILKNANEQFLIDEIRGLRNLMKNHPMDKTALAQEVDWVPGEVPVSEYHYYARITKKNHQQVLETEDMETMLKNVVFPPPASVKAWPYQSTIWRSADGKIYLLMSAWAKLGRPSYEEQLIEIALDITPQKQVLAQYRKNLFLVFILGVLAAASLGIIVANKGMHALNEITQAAERISINQLHKDFSIADWPKELRNLAKAFNQMLSRLENAFKRLSQFSAELAHELRTPINNLMGEAEITLSRPRSVVEYQQVLESSLEEYARLLRMIESLLFLARAENPHSNIKPALLNVSNELRSIAEFYEAVAAEMNVLIHCEGDGKIYADPILFRRAMSNLISNALKYSPNGGKVTISVTHDSHQKILIAVSDNGIGIAKEHLPYIVDRFYRVNPIEISDPGGMGLGLAIVKSIMDLHHGSLTITSKIGLGTTAVLLFPIQSCENHILKSI